MSEKNKRREDMRENERSPDPRSKFNVNELKCIYAKNI